ncbi:MAG: hypothetical protein R3B84_06300 [Zavarzinella sp.]
MAINTNCPFCGAEYRLKDEFIGKRVTCKKNDCRKVFVVQTEQVAAPNVAELEQLAAAAFSDDGIPTESGGESSGPPISVTCIRCDHIWDVEAERAGKNVLCPECRSPNKVPAKKAEKKADWRDAGKRSGMLKTTEPEVVGSWGAGDVSTASDQTIRDAYQRQQELDPEEISEKRAKFFKRILLLLPVLAGIGVAIYLMIGSVRQGRIEGKMEDSLTELRDPKTGHPNKMFHSIALAGSGEYKVRTATNTEEMNKGLKDFQLARNLLTDYRTPIDRTMMLGKIAVAMTCMFGTEEQIANGTRLADTEVLKEIRQTLQRIPMEHRHLLEMTLRELVRKLNDEGRAHLVIQTASLVVTTDQPQWADFVGQVGITLNSLGAKEAAIDAASRLPENTTSHAANALKTILEIKPKEKGGIVSSRESESYVAGAKVDATKVQTLASAVKNLDKINVLSAGLIAVPQDKLSDFTAVANLLQEELAKTTTNDLTPEQSLGCLNILARFGPVSQMEAIVARIPDAPTKSWGKLIVMRNRFQPDAPTVAKSDVDSIGDPEKDFAAANALLELARFKASIGESNFSKEVAVLSTGKVRPFGTVGLILGQLDVDQR